VLVSARLSILGVASPPWAGPAEQRACELHRYGCGGVSWFVFEKEKNSKCVFRLFCFCSEQWQATEASSSEQLRSKVGNILAKAAALRITLSIDGVSVASKSHTHPSHSETSRLFPRVHITVTLFED
jgi:hypothetical protein